MNKIFKWYVSVSLVLRVFVAFIAGSLLGGLCWLISSRTGQPLMPALLPWISPFGAVLINMLKMIVIPIIFFSLITGAASLPLKRFGVIGAKVIGWYLLTSLLATLVGVVLALVINPGGGVDLTGWEQMAGSVMNGVGDLKQQADNASGFAGILVNMFQNPFAALASGNFLPVIVFSILMGLGIRVSLEANPDQVVQNRLNNLLDIIESLRDVMFKLVDWILEYSPIGVLALSFINFGVYGANIVGPYVRLTLGIILGILCMIFVFYSLLIALITRTNPFRLFKSIQEAMLTAFVTRSSAATLPVSMRVAADKLKVSGELAGFSLPLGATVNMDGVCVHLPMFAILAANMFDIHLTASGLALLLITTVLASIGAGGVPGGSLMLLFIILQPMGLEPGQVAVIVAIALGINPILDMFETANNVTGDLVCTYVVAKREKLVEGE
ncbi:MAG TPA: dicarboxylate/amino acid:cation symporter [bacterium]|nr:dicarboxylate/amino acid:cation symporter [bacterium]HPN44818.1 dicarboxylate/amino acid:cation symporter [bacterium]